MAKYQQGLGKTRFRQFTRELNKIVRDTKRNTGYFSDLQQIDSNLSDLITEFDSEQETEFTPNWNTIWQPRMSELKERAIASLATFFSQPPEQEEDSEDDAPNPIVPLPNQEEIEVLGYIDDIPIVSNDSYRVLSTIATRRRRGWINEDEMLEYIIPFRQFVIAIQIIGGLLYIWVTGS